MQRTLSLPWQTQPFLAHSTSLILSGLGVQSVISWNVANRRRSSSLSLGQYLASGGRTILSRCVVADALDVGLDEDDWPFEGAGLVCAMPTRLRFNRSSLACELRAGLSGSLDGC